jgi:hypothetical protein
MRQFKLNKPVLILIVLLSTTSGSAVKDAIAEPSNGGRSQTSQTHFAQADQKLSPRKDLLRDRNGFQIGEIELRSDEHQVLRDKNGLKVGEYDPKSNQTRDKDGFLMGTGNLLVGRIDKGSRTDRDVLRDKNGFQLGEISVGQDGRETLRDRNGFKLGEYDPKNNQTRDKNGSLVGTGNLLPALLKKPGN